MVLRDLAKLVFGYILVFSYTARSFGNAFPCVPCNPDRRAVQSRSLMAVAGIGTINITLLSGIG